MTDEQREKLSQIVGELSALQSEAQVEAGYHLSFARRCSDAEAHLEANSTGLLKIATELANLALSETEETHAHFDEASNFGEGDDPLIVFKTPK